ncbi:MAG: hypothetical protein KF784_06220 [Fimbriimonadaceae bacterium]|nr:hypothetical protein [Fimbriimonadaceae bacterium]
MKRNTIKNRGAASLAAIAALGFATLAAVPLGSAAKSHESQQPLQAIDMIDSTHLAKDVKLIDGSLLIDDVKLLDPKDIVDVSDIELFDGRHLVVNVKLLDPDKIADIDEMGTVTVFDPIDVADIEPTDAPRLIIGAKLVDAGAIDAVDATEAQDLPELNIVESVDAKLTDHLGIRLVETEDVVCESLAIQDVMETKFTIELKGATADQICRALASLADIKIDASKVEGVVIDEIKLDEVSLKQVLDLVARALDVTWQRVSEREFSIG